MGIIIIVYRSSKQTLGRQPNLTTRGPVAGGWTQAQVAVMATSEPKMPLATSWHQLGSCRVSAVNVGLRVKVTMHAQGV